VFVFPLRALVADQSYHLTEAFLRVGLSVAVVTGETSQGDRDQAFASLASGDLDVVLTTPEFLHFHAARFAAAGRVRFLVVDEAHHVGLSRAGNRPAYARLGEARSVLGDPVTLAVTATASDEVAERIIDTLGISRTILDPTVRDNLLIEDRRGRDDRDAHLVAVASRSEKCVVYVNSRDASVRLARMIRKRVPELAWRTAFYNGGLSRSVRTAVEHAFRAGDVRIVVATSAFGEGVNIPDVRHVMLYHLPFNDVEFNQMAGRCGRDGALARVHLLFGEKDARINEAILSSCAPTRDDLATLYRVLSAIAAESTDGFEVTNADLAARCVRLRPGCRLDDRGVSCAVGVFRELGLVTGEGHGAYRRLTVVPDAPRTELNQSVRYREGLDELEEFASFREWALSATSDELLARLNRPILPTRP
jgi:single-stranded-DNA-specific exonuclease